VQATALLGHGTRAVQLFDLLNPVQHSDTPEKAARYRVEPYVVVADVYGEPPHTGRGGWTWYTGAAGWLYRVALEDVLGFRVEGQTLCLQPCIADGWPGFELTYRRGRTTYRLEVKNPHGLERGKPQIILDGRTVTSGAIELVDDGGTHEVRVVLEHD
jgi:cyclic beta-1,2-glucan synthetase